MEQAQDKIGHYCGVVGIYSAAEINIPEKLFFSLFALQHRGQEGCGIAYRKGGSIVAYKDLGMVASVLGRYLNEEKPSRIGIGHVRYSTRGANKLENVQPMVVNCNKGEIALAHNGNVTNTQDLKARLFAEGSIFQSTSDAELILHYLSRLREEDFTGALAETLRRLEGAYSLVMARDETLIGIRDPLGFRPLYFGTGGGMSVFASETCALDMLQIQDYRAVEPGEMILVDAEGARSVFFAPSQRKRQCVFELVYFARPDSSMFGLSVHLARKKMGAALARADREAGFPAADMVLPVPDSGNSAALGYAEEAGLPFEMGLTRNHYTGRSFIMPTQGQRELAVRMKLHPVRDVLEGKRVVLVDDSLVRGTTSRNIVGLIREAGVKEVHLRLSSPEIKWPCFFGIDVPTRAELISNRMDPAAISRYINTDSVRFLEESSLRACLPNPGDFCYACFNGDYPCKVSLREEQL
ncbi:MAG: amidophosphoribosyltransferase [Spirochaetaceae bacterium]|nr:amidophosphoribosyltransferase [Spirochaetaceae bacterium]